MKIKYLLTTLLGVFVLFSAFVSADTVDGYTSSSEICKRTFLQLGLTNNSSFSDLGCGNIDFDSPVYLCIANRQTPYYSNIPGVVSTNVSDKIICYNSPISDIEGEKTITNCFGIEGRNCSAGEIYFSNSPITYGTPSQGGDSGNSGNGDTEGGAIIQGGTDTFTPVINRMVEIAGEFIPYIVYIFIGALGVSLLWKAVKYILGYLKGKSTRAVKGR